jgi:hypothetical protein
MYEMIYKFDEIFKRNPRALEEMESRSLKKSLNFIGNKRKSSQEINLNKFKEIGESDDNSKSIISVSSNTLEKSLLSVNNPQTSSLNKFSNLKNLKVKIPQQEKRDQESDGSRKSYQNENSKYPTVIDQTKEDTKEFIKLLKEMNKQDMTQQDKQRMNNYLSKSILDMQKKVSSDIQLMNTQNQVNSNYMN